MSTENAPQLIEFSPTDVHALLKSGEAVLIDVREATEYEAERIAGALLLPLSTFDPDFFPKIKGIPIILMCALGQRSTTAAKALINAGFGTIHQLRGGLKAWVEDGLPTDAG